MADMPLQADTACSNPAPATTSPPDSPAPALIGPWAGSYEELPALPRNAVHSMIEALMQRLDEIDGDPDVELNGDENDDPGDLADSAWVEWTSMRGAAKSGSNFPLGLEDAEDDEGGGDDARSEDEPGFEPADRHWANMRGSGPGCTIGDPDAEHDGREEENAY